jgi:phosphatidylinositol alpha-1,6-mannosyltransferase
VKKQKLEVLFLARKFPPSVGGMERFAYDLSTSLEDKVYLKKITWGGSNAYLPIVLPIFFFRAAWKLIFDKGIKIIHIQDGVMAPLGWLLARIFRKPYIVVAHGLDITYDKASYQKIILPFVCKANSIVSISSATQDEVIQRGVDIDRCSVITLGMHDDYKNPHPDKKLLSSECGVNLDDRKVLLTAGRLVKRKGVAWFVSSVLPELVEKNEKVTYLIVGEGQERERIEKLVLELKLADHVLLLGRVSDEMRVLAYQSCDVFVMPNIPVDGDMEGFGLVALEASLAGVPVVASGIEGITDAIKDGKNGILINTKDQKAYLAKIQTILDDSKYARKLGADFRKYTLENYNWDQIATKYVGIYERIVGK